jgi:hypothetical protein
MSQDLVHVKDSAEYDRDISPEKLKEIFQKFPSGSLLGVSACICQIAVVVEL